MKLALAFILTLPIIILIYLNSSLFYTPSFSKSDGSIYNTDVYKQLQFLKIKLRNGAGEEMQRVFPEGFIFINALYGLSWNGLLDNIQSSHSIYQEGLTEIAWALNEIQSQKGKETFNHELPIEYGAFYAGWSNYLLGKKLLLISPAERDSLELNQFRKNCEMIATAVRESPHPYLESYQGLCWPADMMITMASVLLYKSVFADDMYDPVLRDWLTQVKIRLDPETGLIPHAVDNTSGRSVEGARGSSQSLMLIFLHEIDKDFASEHFQIYRSQFLTSRFWLPAIREYPKKMNGEGDYDSGPVIWGIGGAASIVGQRTMAVFDKWNEYQALRNCIQGFGIGLKTKTGKKYLFGKIPIADAFIAWSNSIESNKITMANHYSFKLKFLILSIAICSILFVLLKKLL